MKLHRIPIAILLVGGAAALPFRRETTPQMVPHKPSESSDLPQNVSPLVENTLSDSGEMSGVSAPFPMPFTGSSDNNAAENPYRLPIERLPQSYEEVAVPLILDGRPPNLLSERSNTSPANPLAHDLSSTLVVDRFGIPRSRGGVYQPPAASMSPMQGNVHPPSSNGSPMPAGLTAPATSAPSHPLATPSGWSPKKRLQTLNPSNLAANDRTGIADFSTALQENERLSDVQPEEPAIRGERGGNEQGGQDGSRWTAASESAVSTNRPPFWVTSVPKTTNESSVNSAMPTPNSAAPNRVGAGQFPESSHGVYGLPFVTAEEEKAFARETEWGNLPAPATTKKRHLIREPGL